MFYIDNTTAPARFLQGGVPPEGAREVSEDEWNAAMAAASEPQPVAVPTNLTFLDFLQLFTLDEQAAIVSSNDTKVKIFLLMATGASYVDLEDQHTIDGTNYLVSQKLLTQDRAATILAGKKPS